MADMIDIATQDGVLSAYVFRPATGDGPWPAVLFLMDGLGIRPALFEMAARMADHGYFVLLPDLFYRAGAYAPMDARAVFSDPEQLKLMRERFFPAAGQDKTMRDMPALLDYLAAQPDVVPGPIAAVGYCMGGGLAIAAAGHFPDRIRAVGAYHPANLATDKPDSVHLLAPRLKARIYIGRASEDANFPDDMKDRLETAFRDGGVDFTLETYPARHGWVPTDTPVHDPSAAERHWDTLFALLDSK